MTDKFRLRHYTRRRFDRLIALEAKLKRQWWEARLNGCLDPQGRIYQRRREALLQRLESVLGDMCFYGLISDASYGLATLGPFGLKPGKLIGGL